MNAKNVSAAYVALVLGLSVSQFALAQSASQTSQGDQVAAATQPKSAKKKVAVAPQNIADSAKRPVAVDPVQQKLDRQEKMIEELQRQVQDLKGAQASVQSQTQAVKLELAKVAEAPAKSFPQSPDGSLTFNGITLYGTIDVGATYQTHGTPLSGEASFGVESLISKNSNHSYLGLSHSGISTSKVGLRGTEKLTDDISAIFKLETTFSPLTGTIADGPGSIVRNNGVALANQSANGDSSRAGQMFNSAAYGGFTSKTFGTVTYGRQSALMGDQIGAYDPINAQGFSPINFSGFAGGLGATEDLRLDNSIKYVVGYDILRASALYEFGDGHDGIAVGYQIGLGLDYDGFSIDATYAQKNDAINVGGLSAAQVLTLPVNTLAGTISDDEGYIVSAKYVIGDLKLMGGYENITFKNPKHPLSPGYESLGGYVLSVVNNTAYTINRKQEVYWLGAKYKPVPKLELSAGWYHYEQNSFKGNGCSDSSFGSCSGQLDAYSILAIYNISKRFDVYGGAMYSAVANGLSNGYLNKNTVDPTVGARFNF